MRGFVSKFTIISAMASHSDSILQEPRPSITEVSANYHPSINPVSHRYQTECNLPQAACVFVFFAIIFASPSPSPSPGSAFRPSESPLLLQALQLALMD